MKTCAGTLFLLSVAAAQDPVPCNTLYVDPVLGNDTNSGTLLAPMLTLTAAAARAASSAGSDTIVLLPGYYEDTVEAYPIVLPPQVSIQGTSALNTILRSRDPGDSSVLRFEPSTPTAYDDVVVDGISIVGRNRCVEIVDADVEGLRVRANPTFANCFLIDSIVAAVDIVVTLGGVPFPGHDVSMNGLVEHRPKLVNCTVVASRVGVFNHVAGLTPTFGESEPGLINCLFSDNPLSDLEGIDALDVITCAFARANMGLSTPIGTQPGFVFDTSVVAPDYVEPSLGLALTPFDLRVRPGSPAIDTGSFPVTLAWGNGTTGQRQFGCTVDIFDNDCEGYGNLRLARTGIDIGADESGDLIIAGYQRGTTDLNLGLNNPFVNQMLIWCNPFPALPGGAFSGACVVNATPRHPVLGFWLPWDPISIQGVRGLLTTPATPVPGVGTLWMDVSVAASVTLTFASPTTPLMLPINPAAPVAQFNWQTLPYQGTLTSQLTNLQTHFLTP